VDGSDPFYKASANAQSNPTNGSWWMVQILYKQSHQRELVDGSDPFYKASANPQNNPTNGSWWMVRILSTRHQPTHKIIPPTAVGGWFGSFLHEIFGGNFLDTVWT